MAFSPLFASSKPLRRQESSKQPLSKDPCPKGQKRLLCAFPFSSPGASWTCWGLTKSRAAPQTSQNLQTLPNPPKPSPPNPTQTLPSTHPPNLPPTLSHPPDPTHQTPRLARGLRRLRGLLRHRRLAALLQLRLLGLERGANGAARPRREAVGAVELGLR